MIAKYYSMEGGIDYDSSQYKEVRPNLNTDLLSKKQHSTMNTEQGTLNPRKPK